MPFTCPVCGYPDLTDRPRSPGSGGSYEICPSCGYQFGHTDELLEIDDATWRRDWIGAGMPWRSVNPPPAGWDPRAQLSNIGIPAPGDPSPARPDPRGPAEDPGRSGEHGQGVVEYLGVLVLVALIIVTVSTAISAIPLERAVRGTLASVFAGTSPGGSGPTAGHGGGAGGSGGGSGGVVPPGGGTPGSGTGGSGTGGSGTGSTSPAAAAVAAAAARAQQTTENGGSGWGNPGTLGDHFGRHGAGVGAGSEQQYTEQAQSLLQRAVDDQLPTKVDGDGVIRVWDPQTNEFGAYNPDGTTRTYFNSSLNSNGNSSAARAERYWDNQPGEDPWSGESGGSSGGGEPGGGGSGGGSGSGGSSGGGSGGGGGGEPGGGDPGGGDPVPIDPDPIPIDPIPIDPIPIVPLSVSAF